MRFESCLTIALLATTAIAPASAQTTAEPDSAWRAALARLTPGTTVRVHNRERGRIQGRVLAAPGPTLTLDIGSTPTEFSTAALDSLWVRGTAAKTGAIVGAIPGAVAGGLLGLYGQVDYDGGDLRPEGIVAGGVAGAAVGAILGSLVGSRFPKWHRQVP